jgi:hypothetical protein
MYERDWSSLAVVAILCSALTLAACGGGGGGTDTTRSPPPPPPTSVAAPSNLTYPSPQVFTVGQAITPVAPTVTGTVSSYAVNPALPAGLTLDTTSGAISGTPTAPAAQTKYTVTASNSGGSATADVMVTINDAPAKPAAITYPSATVVLATNQPINDSLVPVVDPSVGAIASWSISPALPAGLSFNDGHISGTPTADSAATAYTITATNAGGQYTFVMTLSVHSGNVLDVGHAGGIAVLRFDGTQVFSLDNGGHWVLWNYATGARIASGDDPCLDACDESNADVAGTSIVIQTQGGIRIRSTTDGHVVATIPGYSFGPWKLATDGSYVVTANGSGGLQVWNTATGANLLTKAAGNYDPSTVYAAAGELRAPITVGGAHVIETTVIGTGVATKSASFAGDFNEWFADGNRFQSVTYTINANVVTSTTAYTYSLAVGAPLDTTTGTLGVLQGNGAWFGSLFNHTLYLYEVGANSTAVASYPINSDRYTVSGALFKGTNTLTSGSRVLTFIDVSGATPVNTDKTLPIGAGTGDPGPPNYAALSPTQWLTGTYYGVLFDGASPVATPRFLDYGAVLSIAGGGSRFAIATASGRVLHYNSTTGTLEGTISDFSEKLALSADGSVLAASGRSTYLSGSDLTDLHKTRIYSLPGDGLVSTWPANNNDLPPLDIDLSADGAVLAQTFSGGAAAANPATGGGPTWTGSGCDSIHLAPDGTEIACNASLRAFPAPTPATSNLFANTIGSPGTALDGWVLGWLDADHILVDHYYFFANITARFDHATVNSPTGAELSTSKLPALATVQALTPDSVYSPEWNAIFSVGSGAATWLSATHSGQIGAVAGSRVIVTSGQYVLSLPH